MDIERTMEFIVENLAAVTVRQQKTEENLATLAVRQDKTERSIRGLQTLVKTGMRILVRLEQNQVKFGQHQKNLDVKIATLAAAQVRTEESLKELAVAQKRTDQKFERWLDSMNKGSNGHKKRS